MRKTAQKLNFIRLTNDEAGGGGGGTWVNVCWYAPLASQSPYPVTVYCLANYIPHLSHFLENIIFAMPMSIYASTLSMWFQAAECNVVNASLLLNLTNNNVLIF